MTEIDIKHYTDVFSDKWKLIERLSEEYAKVAGLTPMAMNILSVICMDEHGCTQKTICTKTLYNKQSVNVVIKSFLKQGYIELIEVEDDRRNKRIVLNEKGKQYAERVIGLLWKIENEALIKLSEDQRKALVAFMEVYEQCFKTGIETLMKCQTTIKEETE